MDTVSGGSINAATPSGPNMNMSMPSANVDTNVSVDMPLVALPSASKYMPSTGKVSVSMSFSSIVAVRMRLVNMPSIPSYVSICKLNVTATGHSRNYKCVSLMDIDASFINASTTVP